MRVKGQYLPFRLKIAGSHKNRMKQMLDIKIP